MTASAVSLALLATACGSEDKKDDAKKDTPPSAAAPAAPAAKGKTDAELAPLLITQVEAPKDHIVKPPSATEVTAASATADKAECAPLVQAQSMMPVGKPAGIARTQVVGTSGNAAGPGASAEDKAKAGLGMLAGATKTTVTLMSYDGKGAEEAFASVKAAGTSCAGGFSVTQSGEAVKVNGVAPGAAVTGGDEAASFVVDLGDAELPVHSQLVVVRKGNTVAAFHALNLGGKTEQPKAVIEAQAKKLG
ncbi:hypothetical protein DEJ50_19595 [Streptomyces venezuelae]|uniref:Uncharacterized protein n=1 Tax=Streptomyces venezuelae TaxID=54571 RepID=A0A5P2D663_STRVZ|nr:hypothetical protein [Streptomyces venezuelae]QES49687.1 hypothetical protein DEJ50_19595 [Streptomyces venezuelae]